MAEACDVPDCSAPRHRTASSYYRGCKSPEARRLRLLQRKRSDYKVRHGAPARVPATGFIRRYRALCAIGYTTVQQSQLAGVCFDFTNAKRNRRVYRSTHDAMIKLYDQLWATPGPSNKTRLYAARMGWLPPMAWDDDRMDDPDYVPLEQVLRDWDAAIEEHRLVLRRERNARRTSEQLDRDRAAARERKERFRARHRVEQAA